jgi:hypothetical protein
MQRSEIFIPYYIMIRDYNVMIHNRAAALDAPRHNSWQLKSRMEMNAKCEAKPFPPAAESADERENETIKLCNRTNISCLLFEMARSSSRSMSRSSSSPSES